MAKDWRAWRDTLMDLGVMGLLPPPQEAPSQAKAKTPTPAPVVKQAQPSAPPPFTVPDDPVSCPPQAAVDGATSLQDLESCMKGCRACPLGAGRLRLVFGEGDAHARMMFIGEGPGRDEDLQGRPFVGKAGDLLEKMIGAIGFKREEVYIANVVKCRPPDNRTPTPQESQCCLRYLRKQMALIQPKVIVTLGATPLRELLGISTGITRIRGQWQALEQIPVMPTFHPAYVLRQYTQEVRRAVWNDLQAAKAWLDEHPNP